MKRVKKIQNLLESEQWALFQDNANLRYLGFKKADFLLISNQDVFYFRKNKSETEKVWTGQTTVSYEKGTPQESENIFDFLQKIKFRKLFSDTKYVELQQPKNVFFLKVDLLAKKFPPEKLESATPLIAPLRMVKDEDELEKIKTANNITKKAIAHLEKFLVSGTKELDLKAEFDYFLAKNGVLEQAFTPIIACDAGSCVLHKQGYSGRLQNNVLFDLGAKFQDYCADISRSYFLQPTSLQEKALFWVQKAQKTVIEHAKPKMLLKDLNEICCEILGESLVQMGVITQKSELTKYFMHSVSHHLGLETHDLSLPNLPLSENMVITVEPGLYFWKKKFGIRIEDDIVITKNGAQLI